MKISFSGSLEGMTDYQKDWFQYHLANQPVSIMEFNYFHHGCAVGADSEAHRIIQKSQSIPFRIVGFPSNRPEFVDSELTDFYELHPGKNPIDRNYDIVKGTDLLVACPDSKLERVRSGTWTTVRRARMLSIPVIVIPPKGL